MPAKKRPSNAGNRSHGASTRATGKSRTTATIRKEIRAIDKAILQAIEKRTALIAEWAQNNPSESLHTLMDSAEEISKSIRSGKLQSISPQHAADILNQIDSYCQSQTQSTQVSYLGPIYSYSYLAAAQYFGKFHELKPVSSIAAVFSQVSAGESLYGVVPIENSTDGRIADTLTMFAQHSVAIYREIHLPINHCLIGSGKTKDIQEIRSKAQALSQCRDWLDQTFSVKVKRVGTTSSSDAAQDAKKMGKHVAAIASREAAVGLGLNVIAPNIEDQKGNMTRFAVIVQPDNPRIELPTKTGNDKTSIMFGIPHRPGSLADVINVFKRAKLNLTWIESFPKPGAFSEYTFFAEFQGHQNEVKVRNALNSLEKKTEELTLLGSYPEFTPLRSDS